MARKHSTAIGIALAAVAIVIIVASLAPLVRQIWAHVSPLLKALGS